MQPAYSQSDCDLDVSRRFGANNVRHPNLGSAFNLEKPFNTPTVLVKTKRSHAGAVYSWFVLQDIANKVTSFFSERAPQGDEGNVLVVYLFGSQATDQASESSDVDIAVLFKGEPKPSLSGRGQFLASELEALLGKEVDLVVLNDASPELVHYVMLDGELLIDRDTDARVEFEVKMMNEYFDVLPYLELYRQQNGEAA
jgi:predicted nucleotidyltransferase